jgi:hypothetical protein
MRIAVFMSAVLMSSLALDARGPAVASPWCSTYGGMSCGYDTFDQCMVSIRGDGGSCVRNPMEAATAVQPALAVIEQSAPEKRAEKKKPPKKPVASVAPPAPSAPQWPAQ